jgi:hypothetical protein
VKRQVARLLLASSALGLLITFPLWLTGNIGENAMIGITLALSWLALVYSALDALWIVDQEDDTPA